jgi:8-oxo-dGTP pyrophosphatase MutT (NUDIX family)
MIHYQNKWFKVEEYGNYIRILPHTMWDNKPFSGIVLIPEYNKKIAFIRIFRQGTNSIELELPRGCAEPLSSPEENAVRELKEEIGAVPEQIKFLGTTIADSTLGTGLVYIYHVQISETGPVDIQEGIHSIEFLSKEDMIQKINTNEIHDGFTLSALCKLFSSGLL